MPLKRVHFSCDEEVHDKLESLKHLLGEKRDIILSDAINDRFKEVITNIATKEGLIERTAIFELNRLDFTEKNNSNLFNDICESLNLKGENGQVSSIKTIKLEIKNAVTG